MAHGSVGPVIAVLAVITVLGVVAGMIGRLCSGRHYDFESWIEAKCSSCVDGRVAPPPPPPVESGAGGSPAIKEEDPWQSSPSTVIS